VIRIIDSPPSDLMQRRWPAAGGSEQNLMDYVAEILADVRRRGDEAVLEYTEKFDGVSLEPEGLRVTGAEIDDAYSKVTENQVKALMVGRDRLERVEGRRRRGLVFDQPLDGVRVSSRVRPLDRVGCYVPGGRASYPSSLVMNIVPAKVAGVRRVVVATPPDEEGGVNPLILVAADICGVDEIYRVGGIQAIAGLAYGTGTVAPVEKIVGPGNKYVTAAKRLVSDEVSIDFPAGPSEILVLADETADPRLVALDLISQAEHGPGGVSGLVTPSRNLSEEVASEIQRMLPGVPKSEMVAEALSSEGFIYRCGSLEEAVEFANDFAPEHIEILTSEPRRVAEGIRTAGLILLGRYTPVSSSDYCMGVNHVLPTEGHGKIYSGLSVLDFLRIVNVVESSRGGLERVRGDIAVLSEAEGLPNHSLAVEGRFR